MPSLWSVIVGAVVLSIATFSGGFALATPFGASFQHGGGANDQPVWLATKVSSSNWAGYAATTTTTGAVSKVTGSWIEPAVTCPSGTSVISLVAFWVGIDGFSSKTVEQTGTLAECSGSVLVGYFTWWELYPLNDIQLVGSVSPGDHISAHVTWNGGSSFTMYIKDTTTGVAFSKTASQSATETSAECIAEAPTSGGTITPLPDFGKVTFGTCTATISGVSGGIGSFSSVYEITTVDSAKKVLMQPSALTNKKTFHVTWKAAS